MVLLKTSVSPSHFNSTGAGPSGLSAGIHDLKCVTVLVEP